MTGCVKVDEISPQKLQGCGVENKRNAVFINDVMRLTAEEMKQVILLYSLGQTLQSREPSQSLHRSFPGHHQ